MPLPEPLSPESPDDPAPSKVWLITGCSSGFGHHIALAAAHSGARVLATARNPDALAELCAAHPGRIFPFALDVTDAAACTAVTNAAIEHFGGLDVVVANAGYGLLGSFQDTPESRFRACFETNFFGTANTFRAAIPHLAMQRSGHLIANSAAAAITNYPGFSAYGAAKYAVEGLCESLAAELKPLGVRVTILQPGPFRTNFVSRSLHRDTTANPDYAATVGRFGDMLAKLDGTQPGDPAKAAAAIVLMTQNTRPPMRMTLGKYAADKAKRMVAARTAELGVWGETPVDF